MCYAMLLSSTVRGPDRGTVKLQPPFKLQGQITVYAGKCTQHSHDLIFSSMKNTILSTGVSRPKYYFFRMLQ